MRGLHRSYTDTVLFHIRDLSIPRFQCHLGSWDQSSAVTGGWLYLQFFLLICLNIESTIFFYSVSMLAWIPEGTCKRILSSLNPAHTRIFSRDKSPGPSRGSEQLDILGAGPSWGPFQQPFAAPSQMHLAHVSTHSTRNHFCSSLIHIQTLASFSRTGWIL